MLGRRVFMAALGALLVTGVAASPSAALSTNNPQWHRCEKGASGPKFKDSSCDEAFETGEFAELTLETGTREIKAKATSSQELVLGETSILCKKLAFATGAKVTGAGAESLSGGEATIKDEECDVVGKPACEINKAKAGEAVIATKPLKATEAYRTKAAAEKEEANFATLLEPKELTEGKQVYATIELSGTCPVLGKVNIEGELALEVASGAKHQASLELVAPKTAIAAVFVNVEKKSAEKVVKKTKEGSFGGGLAIELANEAAWWLMHK